CIEGGRCAPKYRLSLVEREVHAPLSPPWMRGLVMVTATGTKVPPYSPPRCGLGVFAFLVVYVAAPTARS
ncbi:MAG: hypothetical protein ABSE47_12975, partial [Acidimicrobiales bacterium]